jgi:hypothetical protein
MPNPTPQPTWAIDPKFLPIWYKFIDDVCDLCKAFLEAGGTPTMIAGSFGDIMWMIRDNIKDEVEAMPAATATFTSGVTTLGPGQSVVATVGALQTPALGTEVITVDVAGFSLELTAGPNPGIFTYTAQGLWRGLTVYGAQGDKMRLYVTVAGDVVAEVSHDQGNNWETVYHYPGTLIVPAPVTVTGTDQVVVQ